MTQMAYRWVAGGVTAAQGFRASGVSAGIKRGRKLDLALVVADEPTVAAGVLTTNRVQAAPVMITRMRLRRGKAQAVLLNSGCANCLTGAAGHHDAMRLGQETAKALKVNEQHVLLASTGLIGSRLPVLKMQRAIPTLVRRLSRTGHRQAAQAILTTDTRVKEVAVADRLGGRLVYLGGMAKGSGMVAPHMATMLCVLTTDVAIEQRLLVQLLRRAVDASFHRITVDDQTSTNDMVVILASGRSGVRVKSGSPEARQFGLLLYLVAQRLAHLLIADGEGATRGVYIGVTGARTPSEAEACARAVAGSLLVKTMLVSGDPNMGRVAAAVGASGARFDPQQLEIRLSGVGAVVRHGAIATFDRALATRQLRADGPAWPAIDINLHAGRAQAWRLTCDLTEEYVRINAHYST